MLLATEEDEALRPGLLARARERLSPTGSEILERMAPGPAERAILEETQAHAYGLVVVPPAGRNALTRMLKGSRVATVVRQVQASVLVARRPPAHIERVLVALSGGASSAGLVEAGLGLEKALRAHAVFFHVVPEIALPYERTAHPETGPSTVGDDDAAARARAVLAPYGRELREREGLVVDEVIAEVEQGAHDLLVVGASADHERSWGREDTTERLLLACPASTLIVRSRAREP
jgi:nucleotide-binding universal stress UspA family protein